MYYVYLVVFLTVNGVLASSDVDPSKVVRARIESCPGCLLNRLPDVKAFIYEDVPLYSEVEFKKIHGAPPELVLLDENDESLKRIPLRDLTRMQCNELLREFDFKKNDQEL